MRAPDDIAVITTSADLATAVNRFRAAEFVTVDTEFMRESTFWPKLCVIQIADETGPVVVDALAAGLDLSPFFALMADEHVLKVFHSGRQDIEIVWHLAGLVPHPVFDTQIAAMVLGHGESASYEQLVQRLTGAAVDKSSRFTDWSRRPLSGAQLAYAAADVTHLRGIYRKLAGQLEKRGRIDWVAEEMAVLTSPETYRQEPEQAWRRVKARIRKPKELAVLIEVAAWREREAQRRDVPRSRVVKDEALAEIAQRAPADAEALGRLRALPGGFERSRMGADVVAAVQRGLDRDPATLPIIEHTRPAANGGATVELFKVLLKMVAEHEGVAGKVLATTDDLERIAADDAADVPALHGWRRELFGEKALQLKHGGLALAMRNGRVVTVETAGAD